MKKYILHLFSFFISLSLYSQTLEEINFSPSTSISFNTYTTDINNTGYVCGYYENLSNEKVGYVITPLGKKILFVPATFPGSYTGISVEGINDSCNVIIQATTSAGVIDMYKGYFNKTQQSYNIQPVTGSGQPGVAKPYGINNKNIYSGWYPNLTDRWGFLLNDSTLSSLPTWSAKRYNLFPTYFYKGNDNDLYAGFYIDGGLNTPIVYDAQANSFAVLPFSNNMKPHDLNNGNVICGEYKQANGFYTGFYGNYSAGSITNFTTINSLFSSTTVQNIINAVNDSMTFVGSYLHPVTSKWVGFIYRPNLTEYRLPKFSYAKDTWTKLLNNAGSGSLDVFNPNYFNKFNYSSVDPFVHNGKPVLNQTILTMFPAISVPNAVSVAWLGFCEESVLGSAAKLANSTNIMLYENNFKPLLMAKYLQNAYSSGFNGYCFGFSYTALCKKYRPDLFSQWYNKPLNFDISQAQNTDTVSILAIERAYLKQMDPQVSAMMFPITTSYWRGMYRLKNEYLKDSATVNPQSLGIGLGLNAANSTGGHNVLPYKIRTPKKFPFNFPSQARDTVFIYDSNFPNDSTQFFVVQATFIEKGQDTAINANIPTAYEIRFQKLGIRDNEFKEKSVLNKTRSSQDSIFRFTIESNLHYTVKNSALNTMTFDAGGFVNNCSNIQPVIPEGLFINKPRASITDTNSTFTLTTTNYTDSTMQWAIHKERLTMGISRKALPSEKDYSTFNHRMITYGNPDNVSKNINCYFIQIHDNATQATTVLLNGMVLNQNDSILTENPSDYIYKVTKISGGNTMYNVNTYTFFNDTAKQFIANNIPLAGNSSHNISSFYSNGNTVIFVDNGLNATFDDTLFIPQVPLGSTEFTQEENNLFKLYPVPVYDYLMIKGNNNIQGSFEFIVSDMSGKILDRKNVSMLLQQPYRLDTRNLHVGTYMLFVRDKQNRVVYSRKFSKQ